MIGVRFNCSSSGSGPCAWNVILDVVVDDHLAADQVVPAAELGGLDRDRRSCAFAQGRGWRAAKIQTIDDGPGRDVSWLGLRAADRVGPHAGQPMASRALVWVMKTPLLGSSPTRQTSLLDRT